MSKRKTCKITIGDMLPCSIRLDEPPPIGIMPKWLWDEQRKKDIEAAIIRYACAGMEIPIEWIQELKEINPSINKRK